VLKFLTHYAQEEDEFLKFDDDDEVQEEAMTWFNGQVADSMSRRYRSCFQALINVWTVPATMLKNKVL
jgi:hypothetical protein